MPDLTSHIQLVRLLIFNYTKLRQVYDKVSIDTLYKLHQELDFLIKMETFYDTGLISLDSTVTMPLIYPKYESTVKCKEIFCNLIHTVREYLKHPKSIYKYEVRKEISKIRLDDISPDIHEGHTFQDYSI